MKKHPLTVGAGIRQQASQLPQMYAQRQQREYQDAQIGLGERKLALEQEGLSQKASQFKKSMKLQREAADVAKGGMYLKGGLALGQAAYAEGMFKPGMERLKSGYQSLQERATGTRPSYKDAPGDFQPAGQESSQPSHWSSFSEGGWKSGAAGGVTGGMMGAGLAKTAGAKKKWQTAMAGAGGGMAATWMAGGGGNPFSMALGGALGGGLGFLL
jgi:hypothetical protein